MRIHYFLAKSGRTFGPFDRAKIEALRESGEYEGYAWFWDPEQPGWQATDPPPQAPTSVAPEYRQLPALSLSEGEKSLAGPCSLERLRQISVVCHNRQSVVSGKLANVTDGGCELIANSHATAPEFQAKLPLQLHLLDVGTGRSMNVVGRVGRAERRDGHWCYRIHWKHCPAILRDSDAAARPARAGEARP